MLWTWSSLANPLMRRVSGCISGEPPWRKLPARVGALAAKSRHLTHYCTSVETERHSALGFPAAPTRSCTQGCGTCASWWQQPTYLAASRSPNVKTVGSVGGDDKHLLCGGVTMGASASRGVSQTVLAFVFLSLLSSRWWETWEERHPFNFRPEWPTPQWMLRWGPVYLKYEDLQQAAYFSVNTLFV